MVAYEEICFKFQQVSRRFFYTGNELSELGLYLFYDGDKILSLELKFWNK